MVYSFSILAGMKRLLLLLTALVLYFSAAAQERFDIVIDEIMADPSPVVGLPNAEYMELKNRSGKAINLQGWKLVVGSAVATFPAYSLPADSFLIISSTGNAAQFAPFGKAIGIPSFPSLANDGATVTLISKENKTVHFVSYSTSWYNNAVKEEGGWSLEMIDTQYPCSGKTNWNASVHSLGGTPGKKNSVDAVNKDATAPRLKNAYAKDASTFVLQFDEPVDSVWAASNNLYSLTPVIGINKVSIAATNFSEVNLLLNKPLDSSVTYQLAASSIKDCTGNESGPQARPIGLPQQTSKEDVVLNEILFNPKPDADDFIEVYNRSKKIIDVSKLSIANRASGSISNVKKITETPFYLFPGEYIVVTSDANSLMKEYFLKDIERVLLLSSLPSYPDDKGAALILNEQGAVIDEVAYADDWHFALLTNQEGISLERIDPDKPAQDKSNWHSAASTAGYATPGYKNSQYKQADEIVATIDISPKTFSPDNDGTNDVAIIQYAVEESGYMANVKIFDAKGREVRHLVKNGLLGLKGRWVWDGLDENKRQLPIGPYIVYSELFSLKGKKKGFKSVVILARMIR
jgi:hypothetical protein